MTDTTTPVKHEERGHSPLGASGYHRWGNCPGSVRACKDVPNVSGTEAKKGTAAHELAEWCLNNNADPYEYPHQYIHVEGERFLSQELADSVREFTEYVGEKAVGADHVFYEQGFDLSALHPMLWGTADAVTVKGRKVDVDDYKNGFVEVAAKQNPQLMYYALGALYSLGDKIGVDSINVTIVQPNSIGRTYKSYEFDLIEMAEFAVKLKRDAERTEDPEAPLIAGSWCKYCPIEATCPANTEAQMEAGQVVIEGESVVVPPEPGSFSPAELGKMFKALPDIRRWLDQVEEHVKEAAKDPKPFGLKWVEGRAGKKYWVDEAAAKAELIEMGLSAAQVTVEPKLKTPSQIEKIPIIKDQMKKERNKERPPSPIADLYRSPPKSRTLVCVTDEREAAVDAVTLFNPIEE